MVFGGADRFAFYDGEDGTVDGVIELEVLDLAAQEGLVQGAHTALVLGAADWTRRRSPSMIGVSSAPSGSARCSARSSGGGGA